MSPFSLTSKQLSIFAAELFHIPGTHSNLTHNGSSFAIYSDSHSALQVLIKLSLGTLWS